MNPFAALTVDLRTLRTRELQPVCVAVVDSGVDATHPALAGRVVRAVRVEPDGAEQKIIEGAVPESADVYGHGTAVAGVIAELAPNARLVDVRVLNAENICTGETLVAGMRFAVEEGAQIINMSLASRAKFMGPLNALCETAYRRKQLVVASKRNMPLADNGFPAEFSSCISVDAGPLPSPFDLLFTERSAIEFVARGDQVDAAVPGGGRTVLSGTSFATPAVTGLCALLLGAYPDLCPFDIKSLLRAFARSGE